MALQVKGTHGNPPTPCDVVEGGVGFPQQGCRGWEVRKEPRAPSFWGFAGSLLRRIALCEPISGENGKGLKVKPFQAGASVMVPPFFSFSY